MVHNPLPTVTSAMIPNAVNPLRSWNIPAAPLLLELPVGRAVEVEPAGPVVGAAGVNVADGSDKQELAAALAAETELGAEALMVPLPAKLQD